MRKIMIATIAFLVSAVLGTILSVVIVWAGSYLWMIFYMRHHSGIGAVAGGISQGAVMLVPILWGIIGMLIVHHHHKPQRL